MKVLWLCLALHLVISSAYGWFWSRRRSQSVCYGRWGCYSNRAPFSDNPNLPESPDELGVQFFLYTRQQRAGTRLDLDWSDQRLAEAVDVAKDTRVILHGYRDSGHAAWVLRMKEALLERADQNVMVVNWADGAHSVYFIQAAANSRLVGRMVAGMLEKWTQIGAQPSSFHLIGASLGAQIAGYAGSHLSGIGRITGLDTAGPMFERKAPAVRLDPGDAIFVDAIHTNGAPAIYMGFGMIRPCGTVDFYPNKGRYQPGCRRNLLTQFAGVLLGQSENMNEAMSCSHRRAVDYFIESINSQCNFTATSCPFPHVMDYSCVLPPSSCSRCVTMGYDVDLGATGVYYVRTGSQPPYCQY